MKKTNKKARPARRNNVLYGAICARTAKGTFHSDHRRKTRAQQKLVREYREDM